MGESIGRSGNCRRCLDFAKTLIVGKKECAIPLQRPSGRGAELIADERRDRVGAQVKIVLSVERRIPMQFPQRPVKLVTAGLGCHVDDCAAMPAVLRVEGLSQNANLRQLIETEKKS
ncbi:MAG: hypothetical protein WBE56_21000 [Terracidiphilus sp.]